MPRLRGGVAALHSGLGLRGSAVRAPSGRRLPLSHPTAARGRRSPAGALKLRAISSRLLASGQHRCFKMHPRVSLYHAVCCGPANMCTLNRSRHGNHIVWTVINMFTPTTSDMQWREHTVLLAPVPRLPRQCAVVMLGTLCFFIVAL